MKVWGNLERAQIEVLGADPSLGLTGRVWLNSAEVRFKSDDGAVIRAFLRNDAHCVLGNSGTAAENIRLHRGAVGVLQLVAGNDVTAEGSLSTALNQLSSRVENYVTGSLPAAANAGRLLYDTTVNFLKVDTGAAIKTLATIDGTQVLTNKDIDGGTASNTSRISVPKNTLANLNALARKESTIVYDTVSQKLYYDNGAALNAIAATASANLVYRSVVANDTAVVGDDVLVLSAASFTETLFTAVGNTGKVLEIVHNGTSLTQVYTVDGAGAETIGGLTTFVLYTHGEKLRIVSDGANWVVLQHEAITPWASYSVVITGRTSNPTRPTVVDYEMARWRRIGSDLEFEFDYYAAALAGAAVGSGVYDYSLPTGVTADSGQKNISTNSNTGSSVGLASWFSSSQNRNFNGICTISTSTTIALNAGADGFPAGDQSDVFGPLNDTTAIRIKATIPITGWNA